MLSVLSAVWWLALIVRDGANGLVWHSGSPLRHAATASTRQRTTRLAAGGYAAARAAAKARREQGGVVVPSPPPPAVVPETAPAPATVAAGSAPATVLAAPTMEPGAHAEPGGAVTEPAPSDAVRRVLEVLGERIGSAGRPLGDAELAAFTRDLEAVLTSLDGEQARPDVVPRPAPAQATSDVGAVFEGADDAPPEMDDDEDIDAIEDDVERAQAMHGMPVGVRNTYAIEGMAEMTPEEYMAALNRRTVEFQRERRRSAPKVPTAEYFDSLR